MLHTELASLTKEILRVSTDKDLLVKCARWQWMVYIGLYTQLIKKAIIGGPHRVAIICMFLTHCLVALFG